MSSAPPSGDFRPERGLQSLTTEFQTLNAEELLTNLRVKKFSRSSSKQCALGGEFCAGGLPGTLSLNS
jgi:hypothetical protein